MDGYYGSGCKAAGAAPTTAKAPPAGYDDRAPSHGRYGASSSHGDDGRRGDGRRDARASPEGGRFGASSSQGAPDAERQYGAGRSGDARAEPGYHGAGEGRYGAAPGHGEGRSSSHGDGREGRYGAAQDGRSGDGRYGGVRGGRHGDSQGYGDGRSSGEGRYGAGDGRHGDSQGYGDGRSSGEGRYGAGDGHHGDSQGYGDGRSSGEGRHGAGDGRYGASASYGGEASSSYGSAPGYGEGRWGDAPAPRYGHGAGDGGGPPPFKAPPSPPPGRGGWGAEGEERGGALAGVESKGRPEKRPRTLETPAPAAEAWGNACSGWAGAAPTAKAAPQAPPSPTAGFGALPKGASPPPRSFPQQQYQQPYQQPQQQQPQQPPQQQQQPQLPALQLPPHTPQQQQQQQTAPIAGQPQPASPPTAMDFAKLLQQNQFILDQQQRSLQEIQAMEEKRRQEEEIRKKEEELKKQAEEMRKQQEEIRKLEEANRIEEAETQAKIMHMDLEMLVETAERECARATQIAEPIVTEASRKALSDEDVVRIADEFDSAKVEAMAALKACSAFTAGKHRQLMGAREETKKAASELIQRIGKTERTLAVTSGRAMAAKNPARQRIEAEARRVAAVQEAKRQEEMFKRFDSNRDGKLSADDIVALCKAEYKFDLQPERLQAIKKSDAFKPDGVPFLKFASLRTMIGIALGEYQARVRREEAAERKKRSESQCAQVEKDAKTLQECASGIETEVRKAEMKSGPLVAFTSAKAAMALANVESAASDVDTAVSAAKDFIAAAKEQLQAMNGEGAETPLEPEAQRLAARHTHGTSVRLQRLEARLARPESLLTAARQKIELQQRKAALLRQASEML